MIRGITVTLYEKTPSGTDAFGKQLWTETPARVANVIVAPASSEAIINELNLSGKRIAYELYIPKGDTHTWNDCRVNFFGQDWHCYDFPEEWMNAMVPLGWNRRVKVERYG